MKIIILEGVDNLGKSTVARALADFYAKEGYGVVSIHCVAKTDFDWLARDICEMESNEYRSVENGSFKNETLLILDRSWKDEYVYGPIYRRKTKGEMIRRIHDIVVPIRKKPVDWRANIYEILLESDPDFAIGNDDDKSYYSGMEYDDKVNRVEYEMSMFREAMSVNEFFLDGDHKINVKVDHDGKFRPLSDITGQITGRIKFKKLQDDTVSRTA